MSRYLTIFASFGRTNFINVINFGKQSLSTIGDNIIHKKNVKSKKKDNDDDGFHPNNKLTNINQHQVYPNKTFTYENDFGGDCDEYDID